MSTSRNTTKTAAKRRAASRRRNRERMRQIFSYAVILLLVLGTISTAVFVTSGSGSTTPAVAPTATPPNNQPVEATLMQNGDQAVAKGDYAGATGFYAGAASMNPNNAEAHFKLGKAILNDKTRATNYQRAVSELQKAVSLQPSASWAAEAQQLIAANQGKVSASSTITGTVTSPGSAITGTTIPASPTP